MARAFTQGFVTLAELKKAHRWIKAELIAEWAEDPGVKKCWKGYRPPVTREEPLVTDRTV